MEAFWQNTVLVGQWAAAIVWTLLIAASCFAILIALPGGWVALGFAILWDLFHGFDAIGWTRLVTFAVLLGVGEAVEAFLGSVYVAKRGATAWGVVGSFFGGIFGAVIGSGIVPILGTVLGAFAGAFAGAVGLEYLRDRRLEPSVQIGFHATVGRLLAVTVKGALATAGAALVVLGAWSSLINGGTS